MAAGNYSFTIEQGATTDFEVQWSDANGTAMNLTGYVAKMEIRSAPGGTLYTQLSSSLSAVPAKASGSKLISLSGSAHTSALSAGKIGVYLGHDITSGLSFTDAYYDIEMTNGQNRERLLQGRVKLNKEVTVY